MRKNHVEPIKPAIYGRQQSAVLLQRNTAAFHLGRSYVLQPFRAASLPSHLNLTQPCTPNMTTGQGRIPDVY